MRVTSVETAIVSLPLEQPIITPIHHIESLDTVLVTVRTDAGLDGIAYLWSFGLTRARVLAAMVEDLALAIRGVDPRATATAWARMWGDINFLGRAGVAMFALSALDIALWDIRGKALGQPVYRLLGGTARPVRAYANGLFLSDPVDALVAEAKRYLDQGFTAMKMRTGAKRWRDDMARVEAVRATIGPEIDLMIDVVQGWTPDEAIRMGRLLERFNPVWIEDPVQFDDIEGMAKIAAALDTPIAGGESDYSKRGFRRLIESRAVDIPMPDLQRVGGITEWMNVAAYADAAGLPITPHVFHEISVHMMAAVPHGRIMEHVPWWEVLFTEPVRVKGGVVTPPEAPGLGLAFDWNALDRHRRT